MILYLWTGDRRVWGDIVAIRHKKGMTVVKANSFIEASYKLNVAEQKIVLTLATAIKPKDEDFKEYTFAIKDFMELLGVTNQNKYDEVKQTTLGLVEKAFQWREGNIVTQVAWLAGVRYYEGEGIVTLQFSPWLKPFLLQIKSHFTQYKLDDVVQFKSNYSVRIYELLKQYQTIRQRILTIEQLRSMLFIEDEYPRYNDFKRNIILIAQREMGAKSDIIFEFEEIKQGRKVVAIKFTIKKNPNKITIEEMDLFKQSEFIAPPLLNDSPAVSRLLKFGFNEASIPEITKNHTDEYINENLNIAQRAFNAGKVKTTLVQLAAAAIRDDYRVVLSEYEKIIQEQKNKEQAIIMAITEAAEAEIAATTSDESVIDLSRIDPELRDKMKRLLDISGITYTE